MMKRGRKTKRRNESNMVEPKIGLTSFRLTFCIFCIATISNTKQKKIVFHCSETPPSIFNQTSSKWEEHIAAIRGVT